MFFNGVLKLTSFRLKALSFPQADQKSKLSTLGIRYPLLIDLAMETYFPCLEVSFTSCQICLLCLCTNVTYSLSLATDLKQNSERTNSITQHIFCRGNQWESFQRLPPPEAICPYVTFCAHCTCPFYLSVTVPCLSILSIILSPSLLSRFHSMPSVQLSRTIPYRFLSLHFPFTQLYIFHLLSSICLSVFISAGRHISSQNGVL